MHELAGQSTPSCVANLLMYLNTAAGDSIYEPFEPAMNYSDFGVKVSEADIPRLHQILEAVGEEEYARMQVGSVWAEVDGGRMLCRWSLEGCKHASPSRM